MPILNGATKIDGGHGTNLVWIIPVSPGFFITIKDPSPRFWLRHQTMEPCPGLTEPEGFSPKAWWDQGKGPRSDGQAKIEVVNLILTQEDTVNNSNHLNEYWARYLPFSTPKKGAIGSCPCYCFDGHDCSLPCNEPLWLHPLTKRTSFFALIDVLDLCRQFQPS